MQGLVLPRNWDGDGAEGVFCHAEDDICLDHKKGDTSLSRLFLHKVIMRDHSE